MTSIFLLFLFIIQVIGFYFLALLYTKVSKFDDLEKKQQRLMQEMDDSLAAYLSEVKDENDQLIKKLTSVQSEQQAAAVEKEAQLTVKQEEISEETAPLINVTTPRIPVNLALKSYATTKPKLIEEEKHEVKTETDDRTRAIQLHDAGKSIEEIARALGKGRTEVELILKFR